MPTELWAARLERPLTAEETEAVLRVLPPERRERLLRVRQAEKRREPLCAYWILRLALREQYHWGEFPEIALSSRGKPYFPGYPAVHFSISHTDGAVLVGVSEHPLGVDIEKLRPVHRRLAAGETEEAFFRRWVRREARAKCSGAGVGAFLHGDPPPRAGESFCLLETFPGYAAGAAVLGEEAPGDLRRYTLEDLFKD